VASESETWNDVALLVNEEVSVLISRHKRSVEKVAPCTLGKGIKAVIAFI